MGRIAAAVLFPGLVLLVGCGSGPLHLTSAASTPAAAGEPGVSTYLCQGGSDDSLLQWRASGSNLSGTYEFVQLSGQAPSEQVSPQSGDLSGTLDGTAINLEHRAIPAAVRDSQRQPAHS
jgi:hypothetical protein